MSSAGREREHQTRKQRIDPRLKATGWPAVPFAPASSIEAYATSAVREFYTANGPADYALCDHGRIRLVVKAKKLSVGPHGVLMQAEQFSKEVSQIPLACQAKPYDLISSLIAIWGEMGALRNRTAPVTVQGSEAHRWRSNYSLSGRLGGYEVSEA